MSIAMFSDLLMGAITAGVLLLVIVTGVRERQEWLVVVAVALTWQVLYFALVLFNPAVRPLEFRLAMFRPSQVLLFLGLVAHLRRDGIRAKLSRLNGKGTP